MNKKIIVSTLALAMGAALAGSVSGTVAWFQYSTRAQAAYIGTTAHCSEMLEIKSVGKTSSSWSTELDSSKVVNKDGYGTYVEPITTGALAENVAIPTAGDPALETFYTNPIYQYADQSSWNKATKGAFIQFELHFHVKDVDGKSSATYLADHNLYLTNLSIVSLTQTTSENVTTSTVNDSDLNKAVRVHLDAGDYHATFASGGASGENVSNKVTTDTNGKLDLNGDGALDKGPAYEWGTSSELTYGAGQQVAWNADFDGVLAKDADNNGAILPVASNAGSAGKIGAILAQEEGLTVTVTIWIEGWQKLSDGVGSSTNAAVWEPATYIGKNFGVGFRFATELHTAHE